MFFQYKWSISDDSCWIEGVRICCAERIRRVLKDGQNGNSSLSLCLSCSLALSLSGSSSRWRREAITVGSWWIISARIYRSLCHFYQTLSGRAASDAMTCPIFCFVFLFFLSHYKIPSLPVAFLLTSGWPRLHFFLRLAWIIINNKKKKVLESTFFSYYWNVSSTVFCSFYMTEVCSFPFLFINPFTTAYLHIQTAIYTV